MWISDGATSSSSLSARRKVSKSTGKVNLEAVSAPSGHCAVTRLNRRTFEVERTFYLDSYGREIYDLLAVEDTDTWPVHAPDLNFPYDLQEFGTYGVSAKVVET